MFFQKIIVSSQSKHNKHTTTKYEIREVEGSLELWSIETGAVDATSGKKDNKFIVRPPHDFIVAAAIRFHRMLRLVQRKIIVHYI